MSQSSTLGFVSTSDDGRGRYAASSSAPIDASEAVAISIALLGEAAGHADPSDSE